MVVYSSDPSLPKKRPQTVLVYSSMRAIVNFVLEYDWMVYTLTTSQEPYRNTLHICILECSVALE